MFLVKFVKSFEAALVYCRLAWVHIRAMLPYHRPYIFCNLQPSCGCRGQRTFLKILLRTFLKILFRNPHFEDTKLCFFGPISCFAVLHSHVLFLPRIYIDCSIKNNILYLLIFKVHLIYIIASFFLFFFFVAKNLKFRLKNEYNIKVQSLIMT